jgi:hypothetical protein
MSRARPRGRRREDPEALARARYYIEKQRG